MCEAPPPKNTLVIISGSTTWIHNHYHNGFNFASSYLTGLVLLSLKRVVSKLRPEYSDGSFSMYAVFQHQEFCLLTLYTVKNE